MYFATDITNRIFAEIKKTGKSQKEVFETLDISENTVKRMTDKKGIGCITIAKIADYCGCSVDYLLGRQVSTPELSENESILLSFFRECSENSQKILLDLAEHYSKQDASAKEKEKISV